MGVLLHSARCTHAVLNDVVHCAGAREAKEKERIWTSDAAKYYESISSILSDTVDGPIPIQSLKVLLSRESQEDPPQYFIKRYS